MLLMLRFGRGIKQLFGTFTNKNPYQTLGITNAAS